MKRFFLSIAFLILILGISYIAEGAIAIPDLNPVEYRFSSPYTDYDFSCPLATGFLDLRIENSGPGDAFNATASLMSVPFGITIIDGDVWFGDIPAGGSAWSADVFTISFDVPQVLGPVHWRTEFDDFDGYHHIVDNVLGPDFPPAPTCEPIPEPSTLLLLGIGIAGIAGYGIRRRRKA